MTIQRGVLKRRPRHSQLSDEIIADVQYFALPEKDHDLRQGLVMLRINDVKSADGSSIIPDGDYDFVPVTSGLFDIAALLPLRKSGGKWDWRDHQ